jgi:CBS domain-containing protein
MSVGRICAREVHTAAPDETVRAAARRMHEAGVGALVVVEGSAAHPIGIVTDRDVALRCVALDKDPDTTPVAEVMTAPARCVEQATGIEEALRLMARVPARRIVVTDADGRLAGILALDDVLELLAEEVEAIGRLVRAQEPAD